MAFATLTVSAMGAPNEAPSSPDWPALNAAAREEARQPVRLGAPGVRPFWNGHAKAFIHPPAFDFTDVDGVGEWRFEIVSDPDNTPPSPSGASPLSEGGNDKGKPPSAREGAQSAPSDPPPSERGGARSAGGSTPCAPDGSAAWRAPHPWLPVPGDIWDALVPGAYTLRVEVAEGSPSPAVYTRSFYRAAVFAGPYPAAARDYREAAASVYASVYNLPYVQAWLESDDPPEGYDLYCYPAKILSSMIRALCRFAGGGALGDRALPDGPGGAPGDRALPDGADLRAARDRALAIACRMADWLIAHSQPEGTPLAHFPPTYWGDRRDVAVRNAGQNMLGYPAHAANAYFDLAEATGEAKYHEAAFAILRTYVRLQGDDGTWPLKVRERDGSPVRANRLVPSRYLLGAFDRAIAGVSQAGGSGGMAPRSLSPGEATAFAAARDRAFAFVERGPLATWNWDGQFEDMDPMPPYVNLQKGVAVDTALRLFRRGRTDEALELVRWCEDQFTVWSDPIHHMDWQHWKTPTALEQYDYYTPIDASMGDMIGAFAAAYRATGDALWLEKAKALADNITRNQRGDGTIPTYFDSRGGSDWVNCMVYVADRLEFLAEGIEDSFKP